MSERVDAVVIGLGPGGEDLAGKLAEAGLSVVATDHRLVGGECPYWGCVPSKMMIRAANALAEARRIPGLAGDATVQPDWAPVAARIRKEATDNWDDRVAVERLEKHGARFVRGTARLVSRDTVEVAGQQFTATRAVVIAAGTVPAIPPIDGLDGVPYWTNHEAIEAERLPESIAVIGGGAIGVELAQVFARFGSAVTVLEGAPQLLPAEEPEAGEELARVFGDEGLSIKVGVKITRVSGDGNGVRISVEGAPDVQAQGVLVATGRRTELRELGVGAAGLDESAKFISVDEHLRAGERLWAIGDITGKGAFTHMSMYQAGIATADILGKPHRPAEYHAVPRVTFTDPEVGSVGLSEQQAREQGLSVRTGSALTRTSARGWIHGPGNAGFVKLVADADRGHLVGATSMGPMGGEVLSMLTLAVHKRVPLDDLRALIYAYPTFHRGIEDALRDLGE